MATTSAKTTAKKTTITVPNYAGPTQEQRLQVHLDVMKNYVRGLMPKAEKNINELVAALQSGNAERALGNYATSAIYGQVIRDTFSVLNSRLEAKEEGLDIMNELTSIQDMMQTALIGGCFMPNTSNSGVNLVSAEKGRTYGILIKEINAMLNGYRYLSAMTPTQYSQNHM